MLNAVVKSRGLPHVIVVGNEKGGSGKTTIAMHIAVALMKSGQRLATIDLDSRQRTLTHYMENRRAWARRCHVDLELPTHLAIAYAEGARVDAIEHLRCCHWATSQGPSLAGRHPQQGMQRSR